MTVEQQATDPALAARSLRLYDLYGEFAQAHAGEAGYDPDDDPDYIRQARRIMGLPPVPGI